MQTMLLSLSWDEIKLANKARNTWPAFIWNFLTSKDINTQYTASLMWKYIPQLWRYWWIYSFVERTISLILRLILTIEPFFVDRTNYITEWLAIIDTMSLLKIGQAYIKFLLLILLYPYECISFIQRYRIVSLITSASTYLWIFAFFDIIAGFTDNRSDLRLYM